MSLSCRKSKTILKQAVRIYLSSTLVWDTESRILTQEKKKKERKKERRNEKDQLDR